MFCCRFYLLLVLFSVSGLLFAKEFQHDSVTKNVKLSEHIVSSSRYPRDLRGMAAPVQVIGAGRLGLNDAGDLSATLNTLPGVWMESGTAQTTKITIRGIGSRTQYGTNRTRAWVDHIPLTAGDGTTITDDMEMDFLERIELLKGTYSAWHGSGMGGSVRFVSLKAPEVNLHATVNTTVGSYGMHKFSGNIRARFDKGYLTAGAVRTAGDGYRENSAYSRNSFFVSGSQQLKGKLDYLLMYNQVHAFTPSSVDEPTFRDAPEKAAANWLAAKGFKTYDRLLAGASHQTFFGKHFSNILAVSGSFWDHYEKRPFNHLDDEALSVTVRESLLFSSRKLDLSVGAEWQHENYRWQIFEPVNEAETSNANEIRNQFNAFFGVESRLYEVLTLSLAGNLNATNYQSKGNNLSTNSPFHRIAEYPMIYSLKLGVVYRPHEQQSYYCSVGHGFSHPTMEESLASDGMLNVNLNPEQGVTTEIGTRLWLYNNRLTLNASIYAILLNNLLITRRPVEDVFYGENAGSAKLQGVELQAGLRLLPKLNISLAAEASENRFLQYENEDGNFQGLHLPGIPQYRLQAEVDATLMPGLRFVFNQILVGKQYYNDANTLSGNAWMRTDLRLSYAFTWKKLQFESAASLRNVFDERYASMILVNAPAFGTRPPRYYYPALPRNAVFSMKISYR